MAEPVVVDIDMVVVISWFYSIGSAFIGMLLFLECGKHKLWIVPTILMILHPFAGLWVSAPAFVYVIWEFKLKYYPCRPILHYVKDFDVTVSVPQKEPMKQVNRYNKKEV